MDRLYPRRTRLLAPQAKLARMQERGIAQLRARIARIEHRGRSRHRVLPFGVPALDERLPQGGLACGALHEIGGNGFGAVHGAAAALFTAGMLARLSGPIFWCLSRRDLFAPALAGVGLHPDRVVYAEAKDDAAVLLCMEEALRHAGLAAVVGEVSRLSMTASRRLQLAAEASGVTAFVLRRWRSVAAAEEFARTTAATTRWRIAAAPSSPLPVPGIGRPRWIVELIRSRAGECGIWEMEACDAQGCLALPAELADRSAVAADGRYAVTA
ncbi:MAG TPA: damage-inducible protein [Stellaceae bacterium]|nr:damage-inducible protein [Stellaceae bacterium]